ncbi:alpha/beta fold hydrolase [Rhodococcus spongiicola]|uniref:Alpha/beta fold hydrolase n=1 Tax=Rhodococcus spongiicola TaxID=2487352 RepID=A0A3S3B584_9NOCA|nr:alpha/beta fold hydrolase [Rhodococcus spongiicola]RVW03500.1 alpha/beta fold hydrolase [Rhodococcus spongiicola]
MQQPTWPAVAVVLPGTGSDADFADRAFREALTQVAVDTVAVEPDPQRVVESYRAAMDRAADIHGRIVVGGVSIGAAVAIEWAAANPDRVAAVLAALPAWTGSPVGAPAAASANFTAAQLRIHGLEAVTAEMTASSPPWLADELTRSWRAQWPHLPSALEEAATYHAPDSAVLTRVRVPVGIAAAIDDAVHPFTVAKEWASMLPRAEMSELTLDAVGTDPAALGRACLAAIERIE